MNHLRLHLSVLCICSLAMPLVGFAEDAALLPEKEEDIPVEFIPTLDTTVSIGLRRLNSGPRVTFGRLGTFPQPVVSDWTNYKDLGANFNGHYYSDGYVSKDAPLSTEKNAAGNHLADNESFQDSSGLAVRRGQYVTIYTAVATAKTHLVDGVWVPLTNPDGTYIPNTTTSYNNADGSYSQITVRELASTSKFLTYDENRARTWSVQNYNQIHMSEDGTKVLVDMHADGVVTAGSSLSSDSTASSGFDISVERRLGHRGRFEWGVSAGVKFAYINAKASGAFPALLLRTTDTYELLTSLSIEKIDRVQPSGNITDLELRDLQGNKVYAYNDTTTAPSEYVSGGDNSNTAPINLAAGSVIWGDPSVAGVVTVHGQYQLKGAYFLGTMGPTFRYSFNDRWAVSGSAGLALAWVGTKFNAYEMYSTWNDLPEALRPEEGNTRELELSQNNSRHKFTPGVYYDLNVEYWATERTAFYGGISGQSIRMYNHHLPTGRTDRYGKEIEGRIATVEMGKSLGWTVGVRTRF